MNKPFIIAELAKNHEGDFSRAKELAFRAMDAGADYIKFQHYNYETMNKEHRNYERYKKAWLGTQKLMYLKEEVEKNGKKFLLSCFNYDLLYPVRHDFGLKEIKVPSTYAMNKKFVDTCIDLFDRVLVSHGFSDLYPIKHDYINYNRKVFNLKCTSEYPAPTYLEYLPGSNGISDHTVGLRAIFAEWIKAHYHQEFFIEKHFNFSAKKKPWEMDMNDLKLLRKEIEETRKMYIWNVDEKKKREAAERKNFDFFKGEWPQEHAA